jgi:transposase
MTPAISSLGVDLSKTFLDCFLLPDKEAFRLTYDDAGLDHLCERVRALVTAGAQVRIVVEASGGYERLLHQTLSAAGGTVAIVTPKRVRDYARAIGPGRRSGAGALRSE